MQGFSKFSWALALFCLPSTLWPLALLVSPALSENQNLTPNQIDWFSTVFWIYPFVLLALSGILFKLHKSYASLARTGLVCCFLIFYGLLIYIIKSI